MTTTKKHGNTTRNNNNNNRNSRFQRGSGPAPIAEPKGGKPEGLYSDICAELDSMKHGEWISVPLSEADNRASAQNRKEGQQPPTLARFRQNIATALKNRERSDFTIRNHSTEPDVLVITKTGVGR